MITDHSSAGFEFLLRDRPLVRIHRPELMRGPTSTPTTSDLLASVSALHAHARGHAGSRRQRARDPRSLGEIRRAVAADLFYRPGGATARPCTYLYEAMELDPPRLASPRRPRAVS